MKISFDLPFEEQIEFFKSKGYALSPDSWRDLWQDAHARAFTVARVTAADVLEDIRKALDTAMSSGETLETFRKNLIPILEKKGWYSEELFNVTPGEAVKKMLTPWRLATIFETNLSSAYSVGRYRQLDEVKKVRPYWQYLGITDPSTRKTHQQQFYKTYPADHSFWDLWYPPNGFRCRCYVRSFSKRDVEKRGITIQDELPDDKPDEGWRYHVGKAGLAPKANANGWTPKTETPKTETPKPKTEAEAKAKAEPKPKPEPKLKFENKKDAEIKTYGTPTAKFRAQVEKLIAKIPPDDLQTLQDSGVEFCIGEYLLDVRPDLAGIVPRGWQGGGKTWEDAAGLYDPVNKKIVICEKTRKGIRETWETSSVFAHETGHAIDFAMNKKSARPEFIQAHMADASALDEKDRSLCRYFLQADGVAARQETFAELYSAKISKDKWLRHYFPKTHEAMEAEAAK